MNDKKNAHLQISFGEGGDFSWPTENDLLAWINQVLNTDWSWLNGQGHQATQNAWQTIINTSNSVSTQLTRSVQAEQQGQADQAKSHLNAAINGLQQFISSNLWILPDSPRRELIRTFKERGQVLEAALTVAGWLNIDLSSSPIRIVVRTLLASELYELGIRDRAKSEVAALKKVGGQLQSTLTKYQLEETKQTTKFDDLHESTKTQVTEQELNFSESQENRNKVWEQQLEESKAELNRLRDTYDQHMSLAAPVEYWELKRMRHNKWIFWTFVALIVSMVAVGFLLNFELHAVGQAVVASQNSLDASQQSMAQTLLKSAAAWHLGAFLLMATLSFWALRLLVRVFLSNIHLENDAAERVTMAKTYLALIRDGSFKKDENIGTVLSALFRPTGDGIIKDDGVPPSVLDFFSKLASK